MDGKHAVVTGQSILNVELYTFFIRHTPSSFWLIDGIIVPSTATADDQVIMNNTCSMDTTQHGNIKNRIQWSKNYTMGCITCSSSLEGCLIIKQWLKKGNLKLCAPKVTLICGTKPVLQGICAKWSLKTSGKKHVQH